MRGNFLRHSNTLAIRTCTGFCSPRWSNASRSAAATPRASAIRPFLAALSSGNPAVGRAQTGCRGSRSASSAPADRILPPRVYAVRSGTSRLAGSLRSPLQLRQGKLLGLCVPTRFPGLQRDRDDRTSGGGTVSSRATPADPPTTSAGAMRAGPLTNTRRGAGAQNRVHAARADNFTQLRVPGRSARVYHSFRQPSAPGNRDHRAGCSRKAPIPTRSKRRPSPSPRQRRRPWPLH